MQVMRDWLDHGFFQVTDSRGKSFSQEVRKALAAGLGLSPTDLRLASFPVGPAWRFALWWREGGVDFAEAQFMAAIAGDFPVLSLGVSVEKGLEKLPWLTGESPRRMDRRSWDWPRFLRRAKKILEADVPACSRALRRPVSFRMIVIPWDGKKPSLEREIHTFVCDGHEWFERRKGTATSARMLELIHELEQRNDHWVNAHFVCDLAGSDVQGLTAEGVASTLLAFATIRDRIRG